LNFDIFSVGISNNGKSWAPGLEILAVDLHGQAGRA
jgi:hypothetical protein